MSEPHTVSVHGVQCSGGTLKNVGQAQETDSQSHPGCPPFPSFPLRPLPPFPPGRGDRTGQAEHACIWGKGGRQVSVGSVGTGAGRPWDTAQVCRQETCVFSRGSSRWLLGSGSLSELNAWNYCIKLQPPRPPLRPALKMPPGAPAPPPGRRACL